MFDARSTEKVSKQLNAWRASHQLFTDSIIPGIDSFELTNLPLQFSNDQLESFNIPPKLVLGKRIEKLFAFWVNQSPHYKLILENVQIIHEQVTLGELDFIIQDLRDGQIFHIELVHKFYLYLSQPKSASFEKWIGPNKSDNLALKIKKLRKQQFPLIHKPETQKVLMDYGIDAQEVKQKLCFNASLFSPLDQNIEFQNAINYNCLAGSWLTYSDLINQKYQDDLFYIPSKENWLLEPHLDVEWKTYHAFKEELEMHLNRKISPMCWMNCEGSLYRFFTVWW